MLLCRQNGVYSVEDRCISWLFNRRFVLLHSVERWWRDVTGLKFLTWLCLPLVMTQLLQYPAQWFPQHASILFMGFQIMLCSFLITSVIKESFFSGAYAYFRLSNPSYLLLKLWTSSLSISLQWKALLRRVT